MKGNRVVLGIMLSATMGGCALTAAQQAALGTLLQSAGLQTQVSDSAGNQVSLTSSDISSVTYNGKTLSASQWAVDASGSINFKDVVRENSGTVPVGIKLTNGQVLNYQYDTTAGAITGNRAVFVPGDDGQYHEGAPGQDLQQAWKDQHQQEIQQHWLTVDLGLGDLSPSDPTFVMAVRPGALDAQTGWAVMVPRVFYSADASGDISFDPQVLNLAAAQPPVNFVAPSGFQPPTALAGTGQTAPAPTPTPTPTPTAASPSPTPSTTATTLDLFDSPDSVLPTPPPQVNASQVNAATFIAIYTSTDAAKQAQVVEFQLDGTLQAPNLDDHDLPPAQALGAGRFTVVATASYPDIASAVTAEGLAASPPPAPIGPELEAAPISAFTQAGQTTY